MLAPGAGVVTSRAHVRTVVTEFGVAELFGRSVRERIAALIAVAHPDVRDDLSREADGSITVAPRLPSGAFMGADLRCQSMPNGPAVQGRWALGQTSAPCTMS